VNQIVIATAVHARAEVKKLTGLGKKERNTAEVSSGLVTVSSN
jgi:hypothetical protein